ncbi:MAG: undecaprenyl-diphosphate phosphatase [Ruminococcaceae bacterium]|nr:undecaprenyl-diphosphate phosphatase [Oscillospiraceae bacterium]
MIEALKAILFGIVEGITEWLPVSSTGHMILLNEFVRLDVTESFYDLFEMVIQLGAILAVIVLFFHKLNPFSKKKSPERKKETWSLWLKVIVAALPSAIIGLAIDEVLDGYLRNTFLNGVSLNAIVVAAMLVLYGVLFILVEKKNKGKALAVVNVGQIDYKTALIIGAFQCLSIIPGTSRSGATILGALLVGVSRSAGAEFSFFLAIPTMLGASGLKVLLYAKDILSEEAPMPSGVELGVLALGCIVAFLISLTVIKGLMEYVRKHSFSAFGVYRIILGVVVLLFFLLR